MNRIENQRSYSNAEMILTTIALFAVLHLGFSAIGLIPSEVSVLNRTVRSAVQSLHTISYEREPKQLSTSTNTRDLPEPTSPVPAPQTLPTKITIDAVGVSSQIVNPEETKVSVLDAALKRGVVRYPGSGGLDDNRPMFLFGHTSRLPTVQNKAYKAFNGLQKLSVGDMITVESNGQAEKYRATSVRVVDKDEALVDFSRTDVDLVLSSCTTFGTRENRVVVRARSVAGE